MSQTLPRLEGPGDAELISAVRGGDVDAFGELFSRHVAAARRLARQLVAAGDADDLVSEAFAKVLGVLQRGGGPDLAFRAYLLTAVRRLHVDRVRAARHLHVTDDLAPFDAGVPFRDTALEEFETDAAARAFSSLPERWQVVLWHTEVEGQRPAEVAPLLGISANSVSALAYRAREGLRQAFVSMHADVDEDSSPACAWTRRHLGSYLRHGLSRRDRASVEEHVEGCRPCAAVLLELDEENARLAGLIAPVVLGGAAAAYVGGHAAGAGGLGLGLLAGRLRDLVAAHAPATAAVGVTVGAVVVGTTFWALRPPNASTSATGPQGSPTTVSSSPEAGARRPAPQGSPAPGRTADPEPVAGSPRATPSRVPATTPEPEASTTEVSTPEEAGGGADPTGDDPGRPDATASGDDPAPTDLAVAGTPTPSRTPEGEPAVEVVVRVSGLADGAAATLSIGGDAAGLDLALDQGCSPTPAGAVCSLTGTGAVATVSLTVSGLPDRPVSLLLEVRPADGPDAQPADNVVRVPLTT